MDKVSNRIKIIRELRGYTQKNLAEKAGMIEAQIQKYEFGTMKPKETQLHRIAEALDIDVAFLQPSCTSTPYALHALLFDLTQEYNDVNIREIEETIFFGIDSNKKQPVTMSLDDARKAHDVLTVEEFKKWLIESSPYKRVDESDIEVATHSEEEAEKESSYTNLERIVYLKRALSDIDLIFNDKMELANGCMAHKDHRMAQNHLDTLKRTVKSIVDDCMKKY